MEPAVPVARRSEVTRLVWAGTPKQAQVVRQWLGGRFQPDPGDCVPLGAYDNFHGIQRVL